MPQLDIFGLDAFSLQTRTAAINKLPYVPTRAARLPIWEAHSITTTTVTVESREGRLSLIPTSPRGGTAPWLEVQKRKLHTFAIPHIRKLDHILADTVQNIRAFGSDELATVESLVSDRERMLVNDLDVTQEYHKLGCLKGTILDADGTTVLLDIFAEWGETQETEVPFDLASLTAGALIEKIKGVENTMQDNLGAEMFDHVHYLCSTSFMTALFKNPEVRDAYKLWSQTSAAGQMGDYLRNGWLREAAFPYGGSVFEEYRGSVGGIDFIAADKCIMFPVGVPGLFPIYYAPAPFEETVNTPGLPRYSKMARDTRFNEFVDLLVESNPLHLCLRPKVLMKGRKGA